MDSGQQSDRGISMKGALRASSFSPEPDPESRSMSCKLKPTGSTRIALEALRYYGGAVFTQAALD